jgi:nitroimidazol reductase NimA-like FMN-containing flavoprotein (pyridoxamine 5'-phosphate oxidase superfamily)
MSEQEVSDLIVGHNKLQLATINPDGTPHLVTMFYAPINDKIGFWTYRNSQKAKNIARDPRVTCLLELGEDYFELRGAMVYGKVEVVTDPNEIRYVGAEVVKRMMNLENEADIAPFVEQTAAKRNAYLVEITRVASWDHRKLT